MILKLFALIFTINVVFADNTYVILPIELNSTDAIGALKSKGNISVRLLPDFNIKSIISTFKIKALGIPVSSLKPKETDLEFNKAIIMLHSNDIEGVSNVIKDKVLTSVTIEKPIINSVDHSHNYYFTINFLKAFGDAAPEECLAFDSVKMKLRQIDTDMKVFYLDDSTSKEIEITLIKQKLQFLGDEKKLVYIELISNDKTFRIDFDNCQRVKKQY